MPAALPAQVRQRCLGHPERAEHVGLELRADLRLGDLLDHAEVPVAGVVDDDVQPPEALVGTLDGGEIGVAVGDVERDRQDRVAVLGDQVVELAMSRAVAATWSPRSRAAIAHSRPKPRDVPVMNQVFMDAPSVAVPVPATSAGGRHAFEATSWSGL